MRTTERSDKPVVAIINPAAGRADAHFIEREISSSIGHRLVQVYWTRKPGEAVELAHRAVRCGAGTVIAAGGDGTLNEVVNALALTNIPMGIVPTGTANDLARMLEIPRSVSGACSIIGSGVSRTVDMIRVNGRIYATSGGIGVPCDVAAIANAMKRRNGRANSFWRQTGSLVYVAGVLRLAMQKRHRPFVTIRTERGTKQARIFSIIAANQPTLGKNFKMNPGADNTDGRFDICLIRDNDHPLQILKVLSTVMVGRHIDLPYVECWRGEHMTIVSDTPLSFLADGEVLPPTREFHIEILPRALRVFTPVAAAESLQSIPADEVAYAVA